MWDKTGEYGGKGKQRINSDLPQCSVEEYDVLRRDEDTEN
jgi:hypothetical protein